MNSEDKAHLESIMQSFKQRLATSRVAQEQNQSKEAAGGADFKRVMSEVIRPAMEDIGRELKAGGHEYEIIEVGDERSQRDARITLVVRISGAPASAYRQDNTVEVSFHRTGATGVTIQVSTQIKQRKTGVAGQRGNYAASEITTELVQKEILKVLDEVFSAR
jgi:hypothetical protein